MHFSTGSGASHSWRPSTTAETTNPSYWFNWRVLVCAIWVFLSMLIASILIWRYEGPDGVGEEEDRERPRISSAGVLYEDEAWRPCIKDIHPAWLLAYRVVAFFILLPLLVINGIVDGGGIFYYYTQWTFTLVTIYFGLGSIISIYGCLKYLNEARIGNTNPVIDAEHGTTVKSSISDREQYHREYAEYWSYLLQIIYQTNAGAVVLTDFVFWLIIFPFRALKDYDLNLLLVGMHSVNAIVLLGDTALNSLRFPWFRISYFLLWTSTYVIFQWVVHACVSLWWPYPFLDLSSEYAPLWYLLVALLHIPCYAAFPLLMKLKRALLWRYFHVLFPRP